MATTQNVKLTIDGLSKFGFKVGSEYLNFSKKLSEDDKTRVVPGAEFEAELYVADSGKRYLNKILGSSAPSSAKAVVPTVAAPVDAERAKVFTPKFQKKADAGSPATMSKDEWAAKDLRISRQGCIQAAVQALAPVVSDDVLFNKAAQLADAMLGYVNQVK